MKICVVTIIDYEMSLKCHELLSSLSSHQYAKHFPPAQNNDERKGLEPGSGKAQNR